MSSYEWWQTCRRTSKYYANVCILRNGSFLFLAVWISHFTFYPICFVFFLHAHIYFNTIAITRRWKSYAKQLENKQYGNHKTLLNCFQTFCVWGVAWQHHIKIESGWTVESYIQRDAMLYDIGIILCRTKILCRFSDTNWNRLIISYNHSIWLKCSLICSVIRCRRKYVCRLPEIPIPKELTRLLDVWVLALSR